MSKDTPAPTSTLQQIADLQQQIADLRGAAVQELREKIREARALVASLERELADLTGSPVTEAVREKRARKASITDEELHTKILKVLSEHATGISAKGIAAQTDVNYPRVTKYIASAFLKNAKAFKRTGSGSGTRFYLP